MSFICRIGCTDLWILSEKILKKFAIFSNNLQNAVFWIHDKTNNCSNDSDWVAFSVQTILIFAYLHIYKHIHIETFTVLTYTHS